MILQELNVKIGLLLDEFQKNSEKVKESAKHIEGTFTQLKGALVGLGVFEFAKEAVAEFADHERNVNRLQYALRGLGVDYKAVSAEMQAYASHMEEVTGFEDDESLATLVKLTQMTGNYKEAMALLPDVLDITASGQMDLAQATDAVGRAFIGDQRGLGALAVQFGIAKRDAKDFGDVMEKIRQTTEGAAAAQKGVTRDLDDFSNQWKQFKENAGGSVAELIKFGNAALKTSLPIAEGMDNVRKAQNKLIAEPVNWVANKVAGWLHAAGVIKTQAEKLEEAAKKVDKTAGTEDKPKAAGPARLTAGRVSREDQLQRLEDAEKAAKAEYDINKKYGDEYVKLYQQNTAKVAALYGKQSKEYQKHKAEEIKVTREVVKNKIDLAEMEMNNLVSVGAATDEDRLAMMQQNSEKIKELWGAESQEYQSYMQNVLQQTQETLAAIYTIGQGVMTGLSDGFAAAFAVLVKEGATGEKAFEAFAKAMGRSFLNSVASAIDAEVAKGMVGYLSNMLVAGPGGAAPVSAYSLPLIAAMAAAAGALHGLAGAMEDGGVMTRKGTYLMAERPSGEPEAAIPFSRMGEAFEKYSQFMDKGRGGRKGSGQTVIVQRVFDNRGAVVASTQFDQNRAAKNFGDMLYRRGIVKR